MKVYVVKMNRFGDDELHSYIIGVFTEKYLARKAGLAEEYWRGGKYEAQIWVFETNEVWNKDQVEYLENSCGGYDEQQGTNIKMLDKTK